MTQNSTPHPPKRQYRSGTGIALGIALGAALGAAFDHVALGVAFGAALGAILGAATDIAAQRKSKSTQNPDSSDSH